MIWDKLLPVRKVLAAIPHWVWLALLAVVALTLWGNHRYAAGRAEEAEAWEAEVAEIRRERDAAAAKAKRADLALRAAGLETISERRKELDNATADLPDQGLTPRQRARVCAELRRTGRRCELPAAGAGAAGG